MEEHRLAVRRTALYCTLGKPGPQTKELWVCCHGYGQLASGFLPALDPLDDGTRLIAAPEALNRYYLDDHGGVHGPEHPVGATWMTRYDREAEIRDYVAYLDKLHATLRLEIPREQIASVALGFSQSTATVARWAALGEARLDRVVLWSGGVPPDLELARLAERLRGELVLVAGETDEYVGPAAAEAEKERLAAAGVACRTVTFGGGHRLDRETLLGLTRD